ncbi:pre-mRNA-splicing factor ISY1 homolog isoform X5 [Dicentrarchus labrax]|uniref:pre-mRNA-splicing factor ISY1 homolog isoform X5 n=1 Tax=Dicentrarchus labrax TaxID=13489 RepID=UPI0021F5A786|nr:pre-mRNA-splicing factor ISY1 homolog isoform X5 [Dicentrarchus labrax]
MARNAEKAMTALARFRQAQLEEGKVKERRPFLASECSELPKAEKWRRQIISEISKKVAQIQNAGLGEFRIRDLNDEINKLLREKGHWEVRIKELGGPDYARVGPKMLDHEGKEVPGNRGYKYFGAARDLPGVRELFEKEPAPALRKTRAELMKEVDAEYYGYRDEDDGVLLPLEMEYEKQGRSCVCVCVCVVYILCVCSVCVQCVYTVCVQCVYTVCVQCVCAVCIYCVCAVCVCSVYILCVCSVYILCVLCVCSVYILCVLCVCAVCIYCVYCVCAVCIYCVCVCVCVQRCWRRCRGGEQRRSLVCQETNSHRRRKRRRRRASTGSTVRSWMTKRAERSRRERKVESPSSHTYLSPHRKRWRRLWSGGRRWSCCSATPARLFRLKVRPRKPCSDCNLSVCL